MKGPSRASAYFHLLSEAVDALQASMGPGYAVEALGLAQHPLTPPGGVSDYDSRLRLSAYLQNVRSAPADQLARITLSGMQDAIRFLERHRRERLRQARMAFNAALTLVLVGTLLILAGVVLLFLERATAGALSASVGAVSNITSALLFRFYRDANDRLDGMTIDMARLDGARRVIEHLDEQPEFSDS